LAKDVAKLEIWDDGYRSHDHAIKLAEKYNIPYEIKKKPTRGWR